MLILEPRPSIALDESAHTFISTFMTHVATVTGYGTNRFATIAEIKTLLLAAIARNDGTSSAWHALYRAIADLVTSTDVANDTGSSRAYLQSFMCDNDDLAHDVDPG